jgi:hypothetical protein
LAKTRAHSNFVVVRQLCAYIVLLVLVLYNTPLYQLCKIPLLVQHYQEHHEKNHSISFLDFLNMHYLGNDDDDHDDDIDRQLPFKEANAGAVHHLFTAAPRNFVIQKFDVERVVDYPVEDHSLLPTSHVAGLFRPPQA